MSIYVTDKNQSTLITSAIEQMCKGQDYICNGDGKDAISGQPFQWVMLNDGHGSDSCINFIRSIPDLKKSELIGHPDPIASLVQYIEDSGCVGQNESSGATAVIMKKYSDRVECINCGDSQFVVFKDDDLIHISKEHNYKNKSERARLFEKGIGFVPSKTVKFLGDGKLMGDYSEYVALTFNNRLACTQALGHNSKTGYAPDKFVLRFETGSTYRILMGSDGLFDMMMLDTPTDINLLQTMSSQELCDFVVSRWLQEWEAEMPDGRLCRFKYSREECDDVSVAIIDIHIAAGNPGAC